MTESGVEPLLERWRQHGDSRKKVIELLTTGCTFDPSFPMPEGPVYMGHDDFETRDVELSEKADSPCTTLADYALGLESQRRERYLAIGGDPKNYVPTRRFPCSGTLRAEEEYNPLNPPEHIVVRCTMCGFAVAIRSWDMDPSRLVADRIVMAGFPPQFLGKPMDPMPDQQEARDFCRHWVTDWMAPEVVKDPALRMPAPALYGPVGSGKSHLLVATAEVIIKKHTVETAYFSLRSLLDRVREGFNTNDGRVWVRATTCELLVLDDVGAERPTDWAVDRLAELVDLRYQAARPIILASNLAPDQWQEMFGARTASRLKGMTLPKEMAGVDQRVARRQTAAAAS